MARKLCCFFCPAKDYEPHELTDPCPSCGRPFGLPELEPPSTIWGHDVIRALPRGFYSATYVVEQGALRRPYVLKVCSERVYKTFGKDFPDECRVHDEVAQNSDHVVDILNYTEEPADVSFGGETLPCWVAQLEFVDGISLRQFLDESDRPTARTIAQVAVDLLSLMAELDAKHRYHNDLHDDNIIVSMLGGDARRPDQLDEQVRAVAIDLGSITDKSKTGESGRLGDLHDIAAHLLRMADRLLYEPQRSSDADYRLAVKLSEVAHQFAPASENQRTPDYRQAIDDIRDAYRQERAPWDVPARLRRLDESYNAQTLHPWFVPRLLVDPDEKWLTRVSEAGPLVVTGMRGCGKTMLLRGLELHARVAHHRDSDDGVMAGVRADGFAGLYVSCTRLLDILQDPQQELHEPYARLFLAYAREAIRALRHVRDVARDAVAPGHHRHIAEAISLAITGSDAVMREDSEGDLERRIIQMLASLERRETAYSMTMHPASAFPRLADAVRACLPNAPELQVLFLLDDVSTRHLNKRSISDLLSRVIFSEAGCAFKITTETQTLELVLRSPGLIESARDHRDYDVFDLGRAVNEALKGKGAKGQRFISDILIQRIRLTTDHSDRLTPEDRLGNVPLAEIARRIVATTPTSSARKNVYHGIRALTAVCVGDIGDVITLYERMTTMAGPAEKVSAQIQSQCYQEYCSRRLYTVNRRDGRLKDFALTFADAAHQLLIRSSAKNEKRGLRQYNSIYIRLTAGNITTQIEQLRELTDAGVFVLSTGTDTPRSKTRDRDPIQQFILKFRKLFGMSSYIGLADRDRFELSGEDLEEWLGNPERGAEILMRHLTGPGEHLPGDDEEDDDDNAPLRDPLVPEESGRAGAVGTEQPSLEFGSAPPGPDAGTDDGAVRASEFADEYGPSVRYLAREELAGLSVDHLVLGMGFEERTQESARRLLGTVSVQAAAAITYEEPGRSAAIRSLLSDARVSVGEVPYSVAVGNWQSPVGPKVLVDVTGLAKPVIFRAVAASLRDHGRVLVAHTAATKHYPLDSDVEQVFRAERDNDVYSLLQQLDRLWSGEEGPYSFVSLLPPRVDDARRRVLFASASPKHQRLLSLLDERDADILELVHPSKKTPRGRLAAFAAGMAVRERETGRTVEVESDDLVGALRILGERYHWWFVERGAEFEVALTGSKMHAVAAAAASVTYLLSQCWYVGPARFDPKRFTSGVGETEVVEITRPGITPRPRTQAGRPPGAVAS
jgi:hypothetical protein